MSPADRSVQFNVPLRSSPREPPDFPSLPARHSFLVISLRIIVPVSLRSTRLDCSVNPLEPKPSCLGTRFRSNKKFVSRTLFLKNFLVRFHALRGDARWTAGGKSCGEKWKKQDVEKCSGKTSLAVLFAEVSYGMTNGLLTFLAPVEVKAVHTEPSRAIR